MEIILVFVYGFAFCVLIWATREAIKEWYEDHR
jgi:hypothetical protein